MKEFIKVVGIGVVIGSIILIIDQVIRYFSGNSIEFDRNFLILFGYYMMYSIPICIVNSYFFDYINTKVNWARYKKYRFVIGFLGSIAITLVTLFIIRVFHNLVLEGETWEEFITNESAEFYLISLVITLVISLFFHAFYYYKEMQKSKIKEQKVIAGTASAKFDALKNQLDPHFLFNSLNVLSSLIDENPDSAQKFTTALSKVYRYVLEQKNKDLVTVDEELEFAKVYMSLLKMRFEDSIIFEIPEKASNPESKVVPLSLQLLLENAVKHNMVTSSKPLHIKIVESNGELIVENNLQPKQIVKKSSGVGLDNIRQRYNLLTERKVKINQEAKRFAVAIPMLTKQISVMRTRTKSQYDDSYVRARKHVQEVKEFYYSLISYVFVIPFLIFINYRTSWNFQWFWFPMFGWGMGLIFHAYKVYVNDGVLGRSWERKKIEQYMQEEENKKRWN
ncbi:2TM domain-containing protein [Pontimicrobium sp. IMCC45349]|uniref:2TM domain-containing protein n=1 Tax=Pontimicrobium sp. IMCC45349 TaxID=3391574 RepID=UPI0039A27AA8